MKKIRVVVKDRNTLVLEESGTTGDYIDLSTLSNVDFSKIEALIDSAKDTVYQKKLKEYGEALAVKQDHELSRRKAEFDLKTEELARKHQEEIHQLNTILNGYEAQKKLELQQRELESEKTLAELAKTKDLEIERLKKDTERLKESFEEKVELERLKVVQEFKDKSAKLEKAIDDLRKENLLALKDKELEQEKNIQALKESYTKQLHEKDEAYVALQRQRASLNVKQTGEDLEAWCNNEMLSYMQNGLQNCTWSKDNTVIREDGEAKGSKADYIFKVFASEAHVEDELLAAVCLDMKDENPDSVNRKKNSDYYKALDNNRTKKKCKYAVLVSNLETDKPNDLPILRVGEYADMYVVRPAYMITFLNMLASLSKRFAELILSDRDVKLELKNRLAFMEEFNQLKLTYLDNPLKKLETDIADLRKSNSSIFTASKKIDELCDSITRSYILAIQSKLEKFDAKIDKAYRKCDKEDVKVLSI